MDCEKFDEICSDREAQTAALGLHLPPPVEADKHVRYIKCPQCTQLMSRKSYARGSGIVIDICKKHGIWLDRDELQRIVEFIRAGGLDRARQIEKQELDSERRTLEVQRNSSSGGLNSYNYYGFGESKDDEISLVSGIISLIGRLFK